jgi:hypothetical protein
VPLPARVSKSANGRLVQVLRGPPVENTRALQRFLRWLFIACDGKLKGLCHRIGLSGTADHPWPAATSWIPVRAIAFSARARYFAALSRER